MSTVEAPAKRTAKSWLVIVAALAVLATGAFLCLCLILAIVPSSSSTTSLSPTPEVGPPTEAASPSILPSRTPTPTKPTTTDTIAPTAPTTAPVASRTPSPRPPTPSANHIIDSVRVFQAPVSQVEEYLGPSIETVPLGIGDAEEVPDGGESRTYRLGKYEIWVNFDKAGIARGIQVVDGLSSDGYKLNDWPVILERMSVGYAGFPDIEAPAGLQWLDASGYYIMIAASGIGANVWTVRICELP